MVSDQIIKVLDNLCDKFGVVIDWSSKNIQPYLKELMTKAVNYKFSIDIFWICIATILLIAGIVLLPIAFKVRNNNGYDFWDTPESILATISVVAFIIGVLICIIIIPEMIACKTFPEKVIIDMAKSYLD